MGMRVGGGRQPLAELGILCLCEAQGHPLPFFGVVLSSPNLPQLPGATAPPVGWFQVKHTVYRGTLCNHVVKFVLPRIHALKCQKTLSMAPGPPHDSTGMGMAFSQALPGTF